MLPVGYNGARVGEHMYYPFTSHNTGLNMAGFPSVAKGNKLGEKAKTPRAGVPFVKKQIQELITKYSGNLSRCAEALGSHRNAIRVFIDRDPELQQSLKDARVRLVEEVEDSVFQRAATSNDTALQCFVLKTQGRDRGWDQSEAQNTAKDIATAAFDFIVNKSKNPAEA